MYTLAFSAPWVGSISVKSWSSCSMVSSHPRNYHTVNHSVSFSTYPGLLTHLSASPTSTLSAAFISSAVFLPFRSIFPSLPFQITLQCLASSDFQSQLWLAKKLWFEAHTRPLLPHGLSLLCLQLFLASRFFLDCACKKTSRAGMTSSFPSPG